MTDKVDKAQKLKFLQRKLNRWITLSLTGSDLPLDLGDPLTFQELKAERDLAKKVEAIEEEILELTGNPQDINDVYYDPPSPKSTDK
ncbi:MAG: hypothetical protein M2R45_03580 [Verrucomicrobia subdivision 3 bacterium]|nr:hypothetical protein [Limisphaerales bacterium]MCS1414787.1 hypothetical protein [Limisphaerales bacterium]